MSFQVTYRGKPVGQPFVKFEEAQAFRGKTVQAGMHPHGRHSTTEWTIVPSSGAPGPAPAPAKSSAKSSASK